MKKLLIAFYSVLWLLSGTAGAAEFLVQAKGHWMDSLTQAEVDKLSAGELQSYKARGQKGDIFAVRPDGWAWGKEELCTSGKDCFYLVVKVPQIAMKDAQKYEESLMDTSDPENPVMLRLRKNSFSPSQVDIAVNGKLSAISINKAAALNYLSSKTGAASEIAAPKNDLMSKLKYWWNGPSWGITNRTHPGLALRNFKREWIDPVLPAYAATQLKKTVKPSGGDYTSLEACMNANEQNLVTADKYFDVEIDGDWSGGADTSAVAVHNYTTDATRYINIYTTATARHGGKYDTTKYRIEISAENYGPWFGRGVGQGDVKVTGVQGKNSYQYGRGYMATGDEGSARNVTDKVISYGAYQYGISTLAYSGNTVVITNSVGIGTANNAAGFVVGGNCATNILNSIGVGNGTGAGFVADGSNKTIKNSYANSPSGVGFSSGFSITTSASDDGSQSTATVAYSTDTFTNVTAGSEDFHLPNVSSGLYDAGTDLSATFTDDIDGDTRSIWSIGVDDAPSGGAPASKFPVPALWWMEN